MCPSNRGKIRPNLPEAVLRRRLEEDIVSAFGTAESLVSGMRVKLIFKDMAYESLVDRKFLEIARQAMPDVKVLHEEFDAAAARESGEGAEG